MKIDGLPENVVPITRGSKNIECIFSSDLKEYLHRSQVWVLPNFSMTDYTSQGIYQASCNLSNFGIGNKGHGKRSVFYVGYDLTRNGWFEIGRS